MDERRKEWEEINRLRHELFHCLKDGQESAQKIQRILPAAMHGLHDALCCLSHSHRLESPTFKLYRGMPRLVFVGQFRGPLSLDHWRNANSCLRHNLAIGWTILSTDLCRGSDSHAAPGPKIREVFFFRLDAPLASATKEDLVPSNWEEARGDKAD